MRGLGGGSGSLLPSLFVALVPQMAERGGAGAVRGERALRQRGGKEGGDTRFLRTYIDLIVENFISEGPFQLAVGTEERAQPSPCLY